MEDKLQEIHTEIIATEERLKEMRLNIGIVEDKFASLHQLFTELQEDNTF